MASLLTRIACTTAGRRWFGTPLVVSRAPALAVGLLNTYVDVLPSRAPVSVKRCISSTTTQAMVAATTTTSANPMTSSGGPSHGNKWIFERAVSIGLLGLVPAGIVYPCAFVDYSLAFLMPIHGHWGILSVISDYVPQSMQGFCRFLLYGVTAGAFVGLMYLNFNDVGICRAVRMVWSL